MYLNDVIAVPLSQRILQKKMGSRGSLFAIEDFSEKGPLILKECSYNLGGKVKFSIVNQHERVGSFRNVESP